MVIELPYKFLSIILVNRLSCAFDALFLQLACILQDIAQLLDEAEGAVNLYFDQSSSLQQSIDTNQSITY